MSVPHFSCDWSWLVYMFGVSIVLLKVGWRRGSIRELIERNMWVNLYFLVNIHLTSSHVTRLPHISLMNYIKGFPHNIYKYIITHTHWNSNIISQWKNLENVFPQFSRLFRLLLICTWIKEGYKRGRWWWDWEEQSLQDTLLLLVFDLSIFSIDIQNQIQNIFISICLSNKIWNKTNIFMF